MLGTPRRSKCGNGSMRKWRKLLLVYTFLIYSFPHFLIYFGPTLFSTPPGFIPATPG